jgi:hypothetical protein
MRRLFVGIISWLLVGPSSIASAASQYEIDLEKDRMIHLALVVVRDNLQSRRVRGSNAVRTIETDRIPHACERLGRTRYDPGPLHQWYPAELAYREQPMQSTEWKINASAPDATKRSYEEPGFGYGNGFFFGDRNTFVTNNHVAQHITHVAARKYDIDVLTLPDEFAAKDDRQIVLDESLSPGQPLKGSLVVMTSIDPDSTSDANGHKTFCGIPFKITREFIKNIFQIPLGSTVASGSPVWVFDETARSYKIAGIMGRAGVFTGSGREVSIGYFYPISIVRSIRDTVPRRVLN